MIDKVSIIVLNFNNLEFTKMCVATLYKNTKYPFELIIVDNASKEEGTKEYLEDIQKEYRNITVHYNEVEDGGFAEGNNTGLSYASGEYICLLNNDMIISNRGWLSKLIKHFKVPKVGLVSCKLLYPNDTIQFAGGFLMKQAFSTLNCFYHRGRFEDRRNYSIIEKVPQITFAFVIARREEFKTLDTSYKVGTFEDNDKCMEYLKNDYDLIFDGTVELYHYETATQFKRPLQLWRKQQMENAMLFRTRWMKFIFNDLKKRPSFWGWSIDDLNNEIERLKQNGIMLTLNRRISYDSWLK